LVEHDLYGKPVATFPDHALADAPHAGDFAAGIADPRDCFR
jgi:hypothetical protein